MNDERTGVSDDPDLHALQVANMLARGRLRMWFEVEPRDAVDIKLPHPEIQGPYNELGEECPWPWDPIQLAGAPIGQYRCGYCMAMVVAGMEHLDYGPVDEKGMNWLDKSYAEYVRQEQENNPDRDSHPLHAWDIE